MWVFPAWPLRNGTLRIPDSARTGPLKYEQNRLILWSKIKIFETSSGRSDNPICIAFDESRLYDGNYLVPSDAST